jgi:adenine-specific DNA-methyltransferase
MSHASDITENNRISLQASLDSQKTQAERNRLGQFATPTALARDVLAYGLALIPISRPVRFLDPAIGTGSFYAALQDSGRTTESARGFEIDHHYGAPAVELWKAAPLQITLGDFTQSTAPLSDTEKATLLICNPPYVRHHYLEGPEKLRLHARAKEIADIKLSGLSGLYCYFLALSHAWMADRGIAGWLIPSEFMDVNYGRKLKEYLLREVTLLHIHRFDPNDVQFDDALVSSAVVWFRKEKPPADHNVKFSYGGSLAAPAIVKEISVRDLQRADKWTRFPKNDPAADYSGYRLADLFSIKRGLATGDNSFFIVDEERVKELDLPARFLRPVLPSSRYIKEDEVFADAQGIPLLTKRQFLIDCTIPEHEIKRDYPSLWSYLETGLKTVATAYICKSRKYWYAQERREAAPIICTYLGRSDHARRPFRFLLNHSRAAATNVYLMLYPQPILAAQLALNPGAIRELWEALNVINPETLLGNGRVYGGGLHKLEPRELANVPADDMAAIVGLSPKKTRLQLELLEDLAA